MKQYSPPKITEKIIVRKIKEKPNQLKTNKYLDNILSKKFLKSYF
jgi:hypothetical protein